MQTSERELYLLVAVPFEVGAEVEVIVEEVIIVVAKQNKSAVQIHFCIVSVNNKNANTSHFSDCSLL